MPLPLNSHIMEKLDDLYVRIDQQNAWMTARTAELLLTESDDDVALLRAAVRINVSAVTILQMLTVRLSQVQSRGLFLIKDIDKIYDDAEEMSADC